MQVMSTENDPRKGEQSPVALNIERLDVLIVDDNAFMRSLIRTVLTAFGCRYIKDASDGADALERLSSGYDPDLIITNWQMPNLDGIELVRLVRSGKDSPNRFVPVIMVSGYSEQSRIVAARDAGVNEFLVKPVSAKRLYNRIATIVQHPRPFVDSTGYFGPDRRRKHGVKYDGLERRTNPRTSVVAAR